MSLLCACAARPTVRHPPRIGLRPRAQAADVPPLPPQRVGTNPPQRANAGGEPQAPALRVDPRFNTGRLQQALTLQLPAEQRALLERAQAQAQAQGLAVVEAEVILPEALSYEATLPDGRLLAVLPHTADYPAAANKAVSGGMAVWRRNAAGAQEFALVHSRKMGQWSIPRGGADAQESPLQAAVREAREEAGLTVRAEDAVWLGLWHGAAAFGVQTVALYYGCQAQGSGDEIAADHEEVDAVGWFTLPQALALHDLGQHQKALLAALAAGRGLSARGNSVVVQ